MIRSGRIVLLRIFIFSRQIIATIKCTGMCECRLLAFNIFLRMTRSKHTFRGNAGSASFILWILLNCTQSRWEMLVNWPREISVNSDGMKWNLLHDRNAPPYFVKPKFIPNSSISRICDLLQPYELDNVFCLLYFQLHNYHGSSHQPIAVKFVDMVDDWVHFWLQRNLHDFERTLGFCRERSSGSMKMYPRCLWRSSIP